ncbi:MAG: thioredoxin family protein [Aquificaceae bacterium]
MLLAFITACQVLLFEQAGCASCKASYRELTKYPQLKVEVYNISQHKELSKTYGVIGAPTLIFLKDGKEIGRVYGYMPPLIRSFAEKCR